ncbi:hypothetical protein TCAL_14645 [Tigriopus californicus]|uniref:BTB domain-containing protein n=1 Tax=Tigriopus californicus TaxID=6832 RepID=A0A553P6G7_TIGCA|nr:hypothetical protein TCAL_14645 [Tigriopus californicus]
MRLNWESDGVLSHFRHLQKTSSHTDLIFHCKDGHVSAHQVVLARVSRLLSGFMLRRFISLELIPSDLHISIPDIRQIHMEAVIALVYTGQVNLTRVDYTHFRSICQVLDIAVPLEDYDQFFSSSHLALTRRSHRKSRDSAAAKPQVFVCGVCHQKFPLKIALLRHKRKKHGSSVPPPLKPLLQTPGDLHSGGVPRKNSQYPVPGQMSVQCPDCGLKIRPSRSREHLAKHLRIPLLDFVLDVDKKGGPKKCSLCSYQSAQASYVARHVGMSHNKILVFASPAQMAFLTEATNSNRQTEIEPQIILQEWPNQINRQDAISVSQTCMMDTLIGNPLEDD